MSHRATQTITDALRAQGAQYPNAGALLVLQKLKAAGIELVQLPEQLGEDAPYWRVLIGGEPEDVYPSPHNEVVISGIARLHPAEARALAAALLAAAHTAEQDQS